MNSLSTSVCIVVGANDVVNPVARTDPNSPIAGMPIIDVDKARTVVVVKRSLSPGFAGIPNPLFAMDNTLMFFSDGKKAMLELNCETEPVSKLEDFREFGEAAQFLLEEAEEFSGIGDVRRERGRLVGRPEGPGHPPRSRALRNARRPPTGRPALSRAPGTTSPRPRELVRE